MRIAYLDCSSGISGDMFMAACLDAGLPPGDLLAEFAKLPLGEYQFKPERLLRAGLASTHVEIEVPASQPERHLHEIERLIQGSALGRTVKQGALRIFGRLAQVEGKLHGKPASKVHFHEVGAVDAILDVVGACVALEQLGISELICSPLNVGSGRVEAHHGSLPVPAPAAAELLRGVPIYSSGVEAELVTPTGAAIVTTLAGSFGPMPPMQADRIGYGAGTRDLAGHPNVARLFVGEKGEVANPEFRIPHPGADSVVSVIQANVDDMSPQVYGYFVERALGAGALDVTCTSIQMKKNRPGIEISVVCSPDRAEMLADLLFDETTTIGLRIYEARRKVLDRELVSVETEYGPVPVKVARRDGKVVNVAPEYEQCRRLASERSVPLKQVMLAAQLAWEADRGK